MVRFKILGPLAISSGQFFVPLSSSRHRKLLAALLISNNVDVSVDRLIDVIWPENPPTTARQQVQNCVGSLNSRLIECGHTQTVLRRGSQYILEIDESSVDERLFCAEYKAATQSAQNGDHARATTRLRHALTLWRGRAMEDIDSDRLAGEVTRLEEVRVRALEQLVDWEFTQGRYAELVPDLSLWTQAYPYNEFLHACLAQALHHAFRTADALEVLGRLRQRLDRELGLGPGPALLRVEAQLRGPASCTEPVGTTDLSTLKAIQAALVDLSQAVQTLINDAGAPGRTEILVEGRRRAGQAGSHRRRSYRSDPRQPSVTPASAATADRFRSFPDRVQAGQGS
ncbi:AfsR/SARP family transcriptional regulator [Micromonospora sp. URMC 107]|uniref:AfsR/SARP family transcriptional regulator n=1 Tax=Micromonospora sp. URMC 107 TaxID=3423418 RepID=UPI003F1CE6D0